MTRGLMTVAGALSAAVLAAGCASGGNAATAGHSSSPTSGAASPSTASTPKMTAAPPTAPMTTAPVATAAALCRSLAHSGTLQSAEGVLLAAGVMHQGDADSTVQALLDAQAIAPSEFTEPLYRITYAIQGVAELLGGTRTGNVDTSAVEPAAKEIAGMCRARHLPVPAT